MNPGSEDNAVAEDRRLQALLLQHGPDYINDAGFTAAVIARLPASRKVGARRRQWLLAGAIALGTAAMAVLAGPALLDQSANAGGWLLDWSTKPLPYVGPAIPLGSLAVVVFGVGLGWRTYVREG